jgi:hypothetical protein
VLTKALLFIIPLLLTGQALALTLSCQVKSELSGPTHLELNTTNGTARIIYPGFFGIIDGRISLVSKAGNGTDSYNLLFSGMQDPYAEELWEFVLHRNTGAWTLFGVGYKSVNGVRHLLSTHGIHTASCASRSK